MQEVTIEEWHEQYRQDFISLSLDWLEKYVSVEPIDLEMLNNPEEHIFSQHGMVFFARLNNETVGTVAMIPRGDRIMELAKLAVAEKHRGTELVSGLWNTALILLRCVMQTKSSFLQQMYSYPP